MMDYKKIYAYLVGEVDKALSLLDTGDLLRVKEVKEILQAALYEAEDRAIAVEERLEEEERENAKCMAEAFEEMALIFRKKESGALE